MLNFCEISRVPLRWKHLGNTVYEMQLWFNRNIFYVTISRNCQVQILNSKISEFIHSVNFEEGKNTFYLTIDGKPLRDHLLICDYGNMNGRKINIHFTGMIGGVNNDYRLYTLVKECEDDLCYKEFTLQGDDISDMGWKIMNDKLQQYLSLHGALDEQYGGKIFYFFTTGYHSYTMYKRVETFTELVSWLELVSRSLVGRPLLDTALNLMSKTKNLYRQGFADDIEQGVNFIKERLGDVEKMKEHPVLSRVIKLYKYLLVQGLLKQYGFELNEEQYSGFERKAMYAAYSSSNDLYMHAAESALFMLSKFFEWRKTGDICVFNYNESVHSKWSNEASEILALAPFTSNIEAHGLTYYEFRSRLNDVIEKGEAYSRYIFKASNIEAMEIKRKLYSLKLLKNTQITKQAAMETRESPFGVLIAGLSAQAKSTLTKLMYYHYAKVFKLPCESHYMFTRTATDEYWSNFDSSMWCILIDDAAPFKPGVIGDVDPTVKEILNVINNVPYCPPQAALEDKGKTPIMAKLALVTTNTIHLNASAYFESDLALRRRIPFVIDVKVKPQYTKPNSTMVDPEKLSMMDDEYPDFWIIDLYEVKSVKECDKERAVLEKVASYSDINDFLEVYTTSILKHAENQFKVKVSDSLLKNLSICEKCFRTTKRCECVTLQSLDIHTIEVPASVWFYKKQNKTLCYIKNKFVCAKDYFLDKILECLWILCKNLCVRFCQNVTRFLFSLLSEPLQSKYIGKIINSCDQPKGFAIFLAICGTVVAGMKFLIECNKNKTKINQETVQEQGNIYSTTEEDFEKTQESNVWYNNNVNITNLEIPVCGKSLVDATPDKLRNVFSKNVCYVSVREPSVKIRSMNGYFIKGNICMVPAHIFPEYDTEVEITIILDDTINGITGNVKFLLHTSLVVFNRAKDLAVFAVRVLPPKKDILKFWNEKAECVPTMVTYIYRESCGVLKYRNIYNVQNLGPTRPMNSNLVLSMHMGTCSDESYNGLCGALVLANTPQGMAIMGHHVAGNAKDHCYNTFQRDDIEILLQQVESLDGIKTVNGEYNPQLDIQGKPCKIVPPHPKSLIRYIEKGRLHVIGTIVGFQPQPKSKVQPMVLCEKFLNYYKVTNNYTKPYMLGWEPWRNNVIEMVDIPVNFDRKLLKNCADSFLKDIVKGLPDKWEASLILLSEKAAVNGLPGVKYIDGINRKSSMGFPWNCTKKKYLEPDVCDKYPEGVNLPQEVWERVENIKSSYKKGERSYPVFTGHLKDEAIPIEKYKARKTRLFTSSPVDSSLVTRQYYLTFVKLVQENKLTFEACPGTVCQSDEWEVFYRYLVQHSEDTIIAGDFSKFDKHMAAEFILQAFRIIIELHRLAGFDNDHLNVMWGIAYDTAYPLCNIKGDLVEMFGTNPSGHSLTVIINSLVNSLYMRYAYSMSHPQKHCEDFKNNVNLLTYGDDNAMGVSPSCNWFNHTAIQNNLATIGVKYTMAEKDAVSVPYLHISKISFLKREWSWNADLNVHLAKLDEKSIIKSLTMNIPSSDVDRYMHMAQVIQTANDEYFFYGEEIHTERRKFFLTLFEDEPMKFYKDTINLPTWAELKERYLSASKKYETLLFKNSHRDLVVPVRVI